MGESRLVNKRLLVVDDDADMRLTLKLALELAGYGVDVAGNAREALELQRRQPADVLITDIFMPDADGFEATTRSAGISHDQDRGGLGRGAVLQANYLPDAEPIVEGTAEALRRRHASRFSAGSDGADRPGAPVPLVLRSRKGCAEEADPLALAGVCAERHALDGVGRRL